METDKIIKPQEIKAFIKDHPWLFITIISIIIFFVIFFLDILASIVGKDILIKLEHDQISLISWGFIPRRLRRKIVA